MKIFENIQKGTLPDRCLQDWLLVRFGEFLLLLLLMLLLGAVALAVAVAVAVAVADTFRRLYKPYKALIKNIIK